MANKFSCLAQPNNQVERTGGDSPARGQACARKYSDLEGCPVKVPPAAHLDRWAAGYSSLPHGCSTHYNIGENTYEERVNL